MQETVEGFIDGGGLILDRRKREVECYTCRAFSSFTEILRKCIRFLNQKNIEDENELMVYIKSWWDIFTDDAKAKGHFGYRIILNSVILSKYMQYLENEKLREEIYHASLNVGAKKP